MIIKEKLQLYMLITAAVPNAKLRFHCHFDAHEYMKNEEVARMENINQMLY